MAPLAYTFLILKKTVLFLFSITSATTVLSQNGRELLSPQLDTTSVISQAQYYRETLALDNGKYKTEVFFLSGKTKMIGEYLDEDLESEDGFFQFFYWNGYLESEGMFKNGRKVGVWKRFESDGTPKNDRIYPKETMQTSRKGHIAAHFPGGYGALLDFISDKVSYPEPAQIKQIEGTVKLAFNIDESGEIVDISLLESAHFFLDQEAIKAVQEMPAWTPAKLGEISVSSTFILPITFQFLEGSPNIMVGMGFQ